MNRTNIATTDKAPPPPARPAVLQRKCACGTHTIAGGECDECGKKRLQRHAQGPSGSTEAPPVVHEVLSSPGHSLDAQTRDFMESRFHHDFSRTRVHTDARAAESAHAVNALAYTVGRDVVFGAGQYDPHSARGRRLLAHELTHTIQQGFGARPEPGRLLPSGAGDAAEREAGLAAHMIATGAVYRPQVRVGARLAREEKGAAKPAAAAAPAECPETHTIPDSVYKAIGEAWQKSKHGEATVEEHGGRVVTDKGGKEVIRTGSGGGGSMSYPAERKGDTTKSTFHTHPYSQSEGSELGVSFSSDDISGFVGGTWGKTQYVGAGTCIFALDTLDQTKRDACKTKDFTKLWDEAFKKAGGSFQDQVKTAVKTSIDGCGICHYQACRPDAGSAIPKTADLI